MLMSPSGAFDAGFVAAVEKAGGTMVKSQSDIGVAFASSDDPSFPARAKKIKGVSEVTSDLMIQWAPNETAQSAVDVESLEPIATVVGGSDETFYNAQWNVPSIDADDAIAAGNTGAGARVAIIDGGIHRAHVDLAANIDQARSRSFIPNNIANWDWYQDVGTFWHGTHVAGIIAAADNGIGTIGVAPGATLISVKALHNGSGSFEWIIAAMIYAATPISEGGAGADIINMSLGASGIREPNDGFNKLNTALGRAAKYARSRGALVVVSAGNDGVDLDHDSHFVSTPADAVGVVTVAATAPSGWKAAIAATNFSDPASYTNYGNSLINIAAPGGDSRYPGNEVCIVPRIPSGNVINPCWVFDLVMSTVRGTSNSSYNWAAGTSMAAPAVSGVAALIVGKYGKIGVQELESRLLKGATDLSGKRAFSGRGYVNAVAALQ
jgi:subtilisin family serine protease